MILKPNQDNELGSTGNGEPLHVLEQRSGMVKGEVSGGLPGLQDMMVSLTSHQLTNRT